MVPCQKVSNRVTNPIPPIVEYVHIQVTLERISNYKCVWIYKLR